MTTSVHERLKLPALLTGGLLLMLFGIRVLPGIDEAATRFDNGFTDFAAMLSPGALHPDLVILDIDAETISYLKGSYPNLISTTGLPRRPFLAELAEAIMPLGPSAVVFDFIFEEPLDSSESRGMIRTLRHRNIIHTLGFRGKELQARHTSQDTSLLRFGGDGLTALRGQAVYAYDPAAPFAALRQHVEHVGFADVSADPVDGKVRAYPVILNYNQAVLMSLALKTASLHLGAQPFAAEDEIRLLADGAVVGSIPVDARARAPITFIPADSVRAARGQAYVPLWRLLRAPGPDSTRAVISESKLAEQMNIAGKIVLIGSSEGSDDRHRIPGSDSYPGMFIHASAISNALSGTYPARLEWPGTLVSFLLLAGFTLALAGVRRLRWKHLLTAIAVLAVVLNAGGLALQMSGWHFGMLLPNLTLIGMPLALIVYRQLEQHGRKDATQQPPDLEEVVLLQPQDRRNQVFISYSHKDEIWLDRLKTLLKPAEQEGVIQLWDDTKIEPGEKWRGEIEENLSTTKVAVLLISPHYLASDFILNHELPYFFKSAEKGGLTILWVHVSRSLYRVNRISEYQAANDPSKPLDEMDEKERRKTLVKVCEEILEAVNA